ncbi:MAG: hypothetical protein RTU09_05170 [Candidatus Thorarchaeota archaeon]
MNKILALLGIILIIIGLWPVWVVYVEFLATYTPMLYLGIYQLPLMGYIFSELMLGILVIGVILLILGAIK